MQDIVAWHNITIYYTCVLHGMIHVLCVFMQIGSYIVDAKNSKIQYLEVHITNFWLKGIAFFQCMQVLRQEFVEFYFD